MSKTANDVIIILESWLGYSESNGKFKKIIDIYNSHKPLARGYKLQYTDEWCAGTISAAFIKAGMSDLTGTEVSCEKFIEIFKKKGIWHEDGNIIPTRGDIILYNWDDKSQPNDGNSDHIGIVISVTADGYIKAIEGNISRKVGTRIIPIGHGNIRGYARPKYESSNIPAFKSNDDIATEVINGLWGSGEYRKIKLTRAGYSYSTIQEIVNSRLAGDTSVDVNATKTLDTVAREVIAGKWGVGVIRKRRLAEARWHYATVQKRVNEILRA